MSRIRPVYGASAAIACGHSAAAAAGWETLAKGGSVADAAIAAAAALTVVLPQACTLGGDAFILYHDANAGTTSGINASGRSPIKTDVSALMPIIPERGPKSCTTPGVVGGWEALHQRFGKLSWSGLFDRAICMAEQGFPVSPGLAQATAAHRSLLERDPGASKLFLSNGPLSQGTLFRQPALGTTLRTIAHDGAAGFYRGRVATTLSQYLQSQGGWLSEPDFSAYAAEWVEPLQLRYRDLTVAVMPPNSYGLYMLLQLEALNGVSFDDLAVDAPERYATLVAAAQAAFAVGNSSVAEPDVVGDQSPAILEAAGLNALRRAFHSRLQHSPPNLGGTAVVAIVDAEGNAAAIVQSVFLVYGSGVADPESGILLNNRMIGFTSEEGHPNVVAPGKRPAHTLNPVLTLEDGKIRHVLLTPGGPGQTLTLTQVLQAATDHHLPLHEAVALPRWSMDLGGAVIVEPEFSDTTIEALNDLDVPARRVGSGSPFFGSVECIERLPQGGLIAVADDRREAHAIAI